MRYTKQAEKLLQSYNSKTAWGNADEGEALIDSINFVFSTASEDDRANLHAMLSEEWKKYSGIGRKLFVQSTIQQWQHKRVHG